MMREYCEYNKRSDTTRSRSSSSGDLDGDQTSKSPVSPPPRVGRRLSYAAMAASLSPSKTVNEGEDMMEIDTVQPSSNNHLSEGNVWKRRSSACSATLGSDSSNIDEGNHQEAADALKNVMEYGQMLQEEYRHDTQEKTRSSLVVINLISALKEDKLIFALLGNILSVSLSRSIL